MKTLNKKDIKIRVSDGNRLAKLASTGEVVFTVDDLSTLWAVTNRQTLRVMLVRYTARGLIYRVWRGLYSISDPKKIDPFILGLKVLHRYAYISCETVLFEAGLINQRPTEITIVSDISKRFSLLGHQYRCRKMRDSSLYDSAGIVIKNNVSIALPVRAKKDMNYFYPKKYYDADI